MNLNSLDKNSTSTTSTPQNSRDEIPVVMKPLELIMMFLAVAGGTLAAAIVLPQWLPGLSASLLGQEPKAFWYLARASGVVAYLLLWLTMVFGMVVSNKLARLWNGGPTAVELHQFVTWLAAALSIFHALILLGDGFIQATLVQVITPFAYAGYKPFWVGIGQIAFYLMLIVAASFYVRKQISYRVWRTLHYVSFVLYLALTLHGVFAGSDSTTPAMLGIYVVTSVTVYFLLLVRVFAAIRTPRPTPHVAPKSASPASPAR